MDDRVDSSRTRRCGTIGDDHGAGDIASACTPTTRTTVTTVTATVPGVATATTVTTVAAGHRRVATATAITTAAEVHAADATITAGTATGAITAIASMSSNARGTTRTTIARRHAHARRVTTATAVTAEPTGSAARAAVVTGTTVPQHATTAPAGTDGIHRAGRRAVTETRAEDRSGIRVLRGSVPHQFDAATFGEPRDDRVDDASGREPPTILITDRDVLRQRHPRRHRITATGDRFRVGFARGRRPRIAGTARHQQCDHDQHREEHQPRPPKAPHDEPPAI